MPKVSGTYPQKQSADLPPLLNAGNLSAGERKLTISSVEEKTIKGEKKLVAGFKERKEQLVLNVTNARTLAGMFGDETSGWVGKTVQLVVTSVTYQNKPTKGIRVAE